VTAPQRAPGRPHVMPEILPLEPGDQLDQKTFHARYEVMPDHVKAELIGGVVYMPSPPKVCHGRPHGRLMGWLLLYQEATPGTDVLDNATTILGKDSEPQPDASLIILPECGGQTREDEEGYLSGPPELVAEVASSSAAYDLHSKRRDYERAGVREYLVLVVHEAQAVWFVRRGQGFEPLQPGADGIFRSELFSGLWLDADALFRGDTVRLHDVLRQGLASPEHARFVESLRRPT
jgi:Uma2 family endonuclease